MLDKHNLAANVRLGAGFILILATALIIDALALDYGSSSAAVSNAIMGALLIILSLVCLRAPLEAAPVCWVMGALALWLIASPFVLGYSDHVIPMWANLWIGVMTLVSSAFIAGEARGLNIPVDAH